MVRTLAVFALLFPSVGAAQVRIAPLSTNEPRVFVESQDKVLAQLVAGGNWETVVVLLNMSSDTTLQFNLRFYDESGATLPLTFVTFPDNQTVTSGGAVGQLPPGASFNFSLLGTGPLQVGWALLNYDDTQGRLGGNAVLRQHNANNVSGAIFEAVVPFSNVNDYKYYMPFDNFQGFVSAMALVNTGSVTNHVSLTFLNGSGQVVFTDVITLPAGAHTSFSVPARYPQTANQYGTIYVEADTNYLAGLGLRFNPVGPFTSVPILNWAGMFP